MFKRRTRYVVLFLMVVMVLAANNDLALAKKRRKARRYGPPPTHPVLLWSRTLSESSDREQRKVAAFKLSQYSQTIYQDEVIRTLGKCVKDQDVEIRALCAKAMGRAGTSRQDESVRQVLLERYKADPTLRNTIVRTFIVREDRTPAVHDVFLDSLKSSKDPEELLALLKYFEAFGYGTDAFTETLVQVYRRNDNEKIKNAVVNALSARARGQEEVVTLLTECTESHNTPLVLNCLAGLQQQGKHDPRTWVAIEKTIASDDPDVLMASLDVINSMPESQNAKVAGRLVELVDKIDDEDLQEKIVLALGVCGDSGEPTVAILQRLLSDKNTDDGVRTAAALTLGKQGDQFPDKTQATLSTCSAQEKSQALRTACSLGAKEIKYRQLASEKAAVERKKAEAAAEAAKAKLVNKPELENKAPITEDTVSAAPPISAEKK